MIPALEVVITADPSKAEAGFGRLQKSVKSLDAATAQYKRELNELNAALASGLTTQAGAAKAVKEIEDKYRAAAAAAAKYANATTAFMRKGADDVRKIGAAAQTSSLQTANLAAQFNDIGVMMAAGQSPFMLALQQGTQVSQVLNQMGGKTQILKGLAQGFLSVINPVSLLTIGVIAGAAALGQWAMSAMSAGDEADKLEEKLEGVREKAEGLRDELRALRIGVSQEELTLLDNIVAAEEALADAIERQQRLSGRNRGGGDRLVADAQERLRLAKEELENYRDMVAEKEKITEQDKYIARMAEIFLTAQQRIRKENGEAAEAARKLAENIGEGAVKALELAGVDIKSGIDSATASAAQLAAKLNISLEAAKKLQALGPQGGDGSKEKGRGGAKDPREMGGSFLDWQTQDAEAFLSNWKPQSQTGGGAGDGGNPRLDQLLQSLQTERETLEAWREESFALLQEANAQELEALGGHNEAKLRLQEEYQQRLAELQMAERNATLMGYQSLFGNLATAFQAGGSKTLKIAKAFSIAAGLLGSYRAYTETLGDPALVGRPFLRQVLAASHLAAGLAQVSAMRSVNTSVSGATGGGASSVGATPAAPPPTQIYLDVQPNARGDIPMETFRGLIDTINGQLDRGGVLVG